MLLAYGRVGLVDDGKTLGCSQTLMMSGAWPPPEIVVNSHIGSDRVDVILTGSFGVVRMNRTVAERRDSTLEGSLTV